MPDPDLSATSPLVTVGFHRLKDVLDTKSHMGASARFVVDHFDRILAATEAAVPARGQPVRFARPADPDIDKTQRERLWEFAAYSQWSRVPCEVRGSWRTLVAYQFPLFDSQAKDGWGYVDLLGVMPTDEPCVVELKKEPGRGSKGGSEGTETPLRMVLEAAGYAVALRSHWGHFAAEWNACLGRPRENTAVPENVHLIAAAPAGFWLEWNRWTPRGRNKLAPGDWLALRDLCTLLERRGYPVHFVSLSGSPEAPDTLCVQPLELFD